MTRSGRDHTGPAEPVVVVMTGNAVLVSIGIVIVGKGVGVLVGGPDGVGDKVKDGVDSGSDLLVGDVTRFCGVVSDDPQEVNSRTTLNQSITLSNIRERSRLWCMQEV